MTPAPARHSATDAEIAFRAFWNTASRLRRLGELRFARWNLSPAQWRVLRALDDRARAGGRTVRATDLCAELLLTKATMSGLIARLLRAGLLSRARLADDQRAASVKLSAAGRRLVATIRGDHAQWTRILMAGLTATQQRRLAQSLVTLSESLDPLVAQAAEGPQRPTRPTPRRCSRRSTGKTTQ